MTGEEIPMQLIERLKRSRKVVVLTGAGVSAESGIPTFRDALDGLWAQFDPEQLASRAGFRNDRALVWGWYEWRRANMLRADPNAAHLAIADLERHVPELTVVTQNVDDLHERAGSREVLHLHGRLDTPRCLACGHPFAHPVGIPDEPEGGRRVDPPKCARCGGYVRPGVVWFGESLPDFEWKRASRLVAECDLMFSIGTSSLVQPAADLPVLAASRGATVVQVNPGHTALDRVACFNLVGKAGAVMPAIASSLGPQGENR